MFHSLEFSYFSVLVGREVVTLCQAVVDVSYIRVNLKGIVPSGIIITRLSSLQNQALLYLTFLSQKLIIPKKHSPIG